MKRDRFGLQRCYYTATAEGSTIRELLNADRSLDRVAVDAFLGGAYLPDRTMFAAVRQQPPAGADGCTSESSFAEQLEEAVRRAVEKAPRPLAVALSGGLDSAVVLALALRIDPTVKALILDPNVPDYGELTAALRTADELHAEVVELSLDEDAFASAVRPAIAAFEMPLYNLHPVSKWWLARGAADEGFAVLSGDGADQVFRHDTSADYLPLVGAAFDSLGVPLFTPFLDIVGVEVDPTKRLLRDVAATLPIRDELVVGPKISKLAPRLSFDAPTDRLADLLRRPPEPGERWGTLALLVDLFEAWP